MDFRNCCTPFQRNDRRDRRRRVYARSGRRRWRAVTTRARRGTTSARRGACGGLRARGMHAASARGACSAGEDLDHEEHDPYEDQEEECFTQGPVYVTAETDAHDDVHGMRVSRTSSRVHGLGFRV